jgi:hypothetical protein
MKQIEKTISPLIDSLFPSFYQSEGENFVAFIRAYYEWLEQNFQLLTLEDNNGFVKGSFVTQDAVTGTVYSILDGDLLVKVDGNDTFKCYSVCSDLTPITTTTDGVDFSTHILRGGSARRLGSIFLSRNLLDYRDIDETIDLFVVFFKEKYLTNIEFDTATNKRLLVKNSLDLYRAKGTDRAIDLFFRLVYATKPQVEYPADVLFQPSGATWVVPTYLEISPNTVDRAIGLVGREITGVTSGAKAFVEKYVKLRINNGYSHVLFISNIKGNFTTRELIKSDQLYSDSPVIYGSLNQITISSSSSGFSIGDIFPVVTSTGIEGLARVTETRNASGQVEFELTEEGYGYALSNTSPSYLRPMAMISDNLVTVSNVVSGNIVSSIIVRSAGSGFSNGEIITIPSANGDDAYAVIITNGSNAIVQVDLAYPGSGFNVRTGTEVAPGPGVGGSIDYFTSAPVQYYNLFDDVKQTNTSGGVVASGLIIGDPLEATLTVVSPSVPAIFSIGDRVYQQDTVSGEYASAIILRSSINTLGGTLRVTNIEGRFRTNQPILAATSGSSATVSSVAFKFPVDVTSGAFDANTQFIISSERAGFSGNTLAKSSGAGAQFTIFGLDTNRETIYVNTDKLSNTTILNTPLNAIQFNLPQSPTSNVAFNIFGALTFEELQIGEVKTIAGIAPGSNYTEDPFVLMYQPYVANMDKRNLKLSLTGEFTAFTTNELITQVYSEPVYTITIGSTSGLRVNEGIYVQNAGANVAKGTVKSITNTTVFVLNNREGPMQTGYTIKSNSNPSFTQTVSAFDSGSQNITVKGRLLEQSGDDLIIKPMNYINDFITGTKVVGESGANGTVILIQELDSNPMGYNADVFADAINADGEILTAQIVDSGFGYIDSQEGSTTLEDGRRINYLSSSLKFGGVNTGGLGTGSGSYRSLKGFLSDLSKLHDGDFYQEYSYNIISNISFDKYAEMFKKVLHTSGTRFFGSVLLSSVIEDTRIEAVPNTSIIVSDTSPFVIFAPELDTAPAPWGTTSGVPGTVRLDDEEVADFANVHIEIRN